VAKIRFDLEQGEEKVGKWTIHYLPPTGGKFAGKLLVTDRRILFEPLNSKQDLSLATAIDACRIGGVVADRVNNYWDGKGLRIPRADVRSVTKKQSGMMKQVAVKLADGQEFVFDNGFLSVDKLAATLEG
jgi:hypothetical protein